LNKSREDAIGKKVWGRRDLEKKKKKHLKYKDAFLLQTKGKEDIRSIKGGGKNRGKTQKNYITNNPKSYTQLKALWYEVGRCFDREKREGGREGKQEAKGF